MFVEYIYMNSTIPKRHAETLRNWNIPFQLKKQNTYRNEIDNLAWNREGFKLDECRQAMEEWRRRWHRPQIG
jgi:hypothetical protein